MTTNKSKSKSESKSESESDSESNKIITEKIDLQKQNLTTNKSESESESNKSCKNKNSIIENNFSEDNLKNKNIIDIKEIAKNFGIKLSDKGKQKNKDVLIQDILIINK